VDEAFATLLGSRSPYHEAKEDLDALVRKVLVLAVGRGRSRTRTTSC
jgi:hypothetical protein